MSECIILLVCEGNLHIKFLLQVMIYLFVEAAKIKYDIQNFHIHGGKLSLLNSKNKIKLEVCQNGKNVRNCMMWAKNMQKSENVVSGTHIYKESSNLLGSLL